MQPSAKALCTGLVLPGILAAPAVAQTASPRPDTPISPPGRAADLTVQPRFGVSFTTIGAGYQDPFFSLEGFAPLRQTPGKRLTFLEGRFLVSTDAMLGGNLMLGQRFYSPTGDRILGGYIAYDTRNTGSSVFHQLGAGFERLGKDWDLRVNAYLPLGDRRRQVEAAFSNPRFQQNNLVFDQRTQFEAAMAGFDAEIGGRLARLGDGDLRGYAGIYYYGAPGSEDAFGVRGRLEARPTDSLRLGLTVQTDQVFDTRVIFNLSATLPGTRPRGASPNSVLARMGESIARTPTITVDEQHEDATVAAINPKTGQPWQFRHVSLGTGTGNGTFENPTGTVQAGLDVAQPEDIVYVQFSQNPGIPAFTIPDRVSVLSTGPVQQIDTEQVGNVRLPLSGSGQFPRITGTVTMGNDTTLSGFEIANVSGNGIQGGSIQNVTIRDNFITNATGQGISLTNVSGSSTIANNAIANSGEQGLFVSASGSTQQQLSVTDNTISGSGRQGVFAQASDSAQQQVTANRNTVSNSAGQGVFMQSNGSSQQQVAIANSTIQGTSRDDSGDGGQGVFAAANGGSRQAIDLSNTQVSNSAAQGVFVQGNGDPANPTTQTQQSLTGDTVTVSNSTGQGVLVQSNGNTQQQVALANSTIQATTRDGNGNGGQGLFVAANGGAQQRVNLNNTQVSNSAAQGVFVQGNGDPVNPATQTRQVLTSTATNINNSAGAGVFVQANGNTQQQMTLTGGTVSTTAIDSNGNGGQGIAASANGGAQQQITLDRMTVSDSAAQGVFVQGNGDPLHPAIQTQQALITTNSTIRNNAGAGVFVQANGNVRQTGTIANSTIQNTTRDSSGNGGQGIFIAAGSGAQQAFTLSNVIVDTNASQGIFVQANGDPFNPATITQQTFTVDSARVNNNIGTGIFIQANGNVRQTADIRNSLINGTLLDGGNGGQGIFVQANDTAQSLVRLTANTITNNTGTGIFMQINGASFAIADVQFNVLQNNAIPGLNAAMNGNQRFCLTLNGNRSSSDYVLQQNAGTFQVVDRDTANTRNVGSVNFQPSVVNFENVITCF